MAFGYFLPVLKCSDRDNLKSQKGLHILMGGACVSYERLIQSLWNDLFHNHQRLFLPEALPDQRFLCYYNVSHCFVFQKLMKHIEVAKEILLSKEAIKSPLRIYKKIIRYF